MAPFEDVDDLKAFLTWCADNGVSAVDLSPEGAVKASFYPRPPKPQPPRKPTRSDEKKPAVEERTGYTEEELYGSA